MLSSSAIEMYITERIRILLCKMHGFPIILVNVQWYKWGTHFEKVLRYVYVNDNGKTIILLSFEETSDRSTDNTSCEFGISLYI